MVQIEKQEGNTEKRCRSFDSYEIDDWLNLYISVLFMMLNKLTHLVYATDIKKNEIYIDGLVIDRNISSASAMGILQSCTKPSILQ